MKPGIYVLTADVENPCKRDKRRKRDWRHTTGWKKGTRFVVETRFPDDDMQLLALRPTSSPYDSIVLWGEHRERALERGHEYDVGLADVLCPVLEREAESLDSWLAENHCSSYSCYSLLDELIASGKVTLADVTQAKEVWYAKED